MITIFIARHGETNYNKEGKYLGRTDVSLNSIGIKQARKLAAKVKKLNIDIIISSPLKRTLETTKIICPDKNIITDKNFIERSVGIYEGLTKRKAKNKYPNLYNQNITRIYDRAPTGGETIKEVEKRAFEGLREIKKKYNNKKILIVTHAFIAKVINKYFNSSISKDDFYSYVLPLGRIEKYVIK